MQTNLKNRNMEKKRMINLLGGYFWSPESDVENYLARGFKLAEVEEPKKKQILTSTTTEKSTPKTES